MRKKIFLLFILSILLICAVPAADDAKTNTQTNQPAAAEANSPLPNQTENDFFPLRKGNFWVYKLSNKVQLRCEVLGAVEKEGKQYLVTSSFPSLDYQNMQKDYYSFENDGVYYYGKEFKNLNVYYDPLIKEIPADITKPQKWEWTGTISKIKMMITVETSGPEEFLFKGTVYPAYKVTQTITDEAKSDLLHAAANHPEIKSAPKDKKLVLTKWYVKGIGRVRELNETYVYFENGKVTVDPISADLEDCKLQ